MMATKIKLISEHVQLFRILKAADRGVLVVAENGDIIFGNQTACKMLDYDPAEFEEKSIFEINPMMSLLGWKKLFRKIKSEEKKAVTEIYTKNKILFPAETKAVHIRLSDQDLCCYFIKNLNKAHRFKDLLRLTTSVGNIVGWDWDLINHQLLFTDRINVLLESNTIKRKYNEGDFKAFAKSHFEEAAWNELKMLAKSSLVTGQRFE
ncbi:MAG: PAS domain-containing protein, partial [Bacteroidota bacterium]